MTAFSNKHIPADAGEVHFSWNMVTDFDANNYTVAEFPKKIEQLLQKCEINE
jgi:hypothetical protein